MKKRIREGVNKCALLVLGFTVIIVALVLIFSRQIAGIFIDSGTSGDLRESVTLYTQNYFYVAGVFYFCSRPLICIPQQSSREWGIPE